MHADRLTIQPLRICRCALVISVAVLSLPMDANGVRLFIWEPPPALIELIKIPPAETEVIRKPIEVPRIGTSPEILHVPGVTAPRKLEDLEGLRGTEMEDAFARFEAAHRRLQQMLDNRSMYRAARIATLQPVGEIVLADGIYTQEVSITTNDAMGRSQVRHSILIRSAFKELVQGVFFYIVTLFQGRDASTQPTADDLVEGAIERVTARLNAPRERVRQHLAVEFGGTRVVDASLRRLVQIESTSAGGAI